jgi:hypothetical protein
MTPANQDTTIASYLPERSKDSYPRSLRCLAETPRRGVPVVHDSFDRQTALSQNKNMHRERQASRPPHRDCATLRFQLQCLDNTTEKYSVIRMYLS